PSTTSWGWPVAGNRSRVASNVRRPRAWPKQFSGIMAPRVASPGQPGRWSGTSSRSIGLERPGNKNLRRRFFVEAFQGGRAVLKGEQAEHLGRVLRARTGQLYELSDQSSVWLGRVAAVKRDQIEFDLLERVPVERPRLEISLLLSLIKFPRFEWCLEKA